MFFAAVECKSRHRRGVAFMRFHLTVLLSASAALATPAFSEDLEDQFRKAMEQSPNLPGSTTTKRPPASQQPKRIREEASHAKRNKPAPSPKEGWIAVFTNVTNVPTLYYKIASSGNSSSQPQAFKGIYFICLDNEPSFMISPARSLAKAEVFLGDEPSLKGEFVEGVNNGPNDIDLSMKDSTKLFMVLIDTARTMAKERVQAFIAISASEMSTGDRISVSNFLPLVRQHFPNCRGSR